MRLSLIVLTLFSLGGCSSFGGVLSSETTWFQDWSCQRQDGVCARTDTIDQITITELGGDPAEAGPVSGYPIETLPLSATPELLQDVRPLDRDFFESEIEQGRPFLETSYADEQALAASAVLGGPSAFSIDAVMSGRSDANSAREDDPFISAFPEAAASAQFAVLSDRLGDVIETGISDEPTPEPAPLLTASVDSGGERLSDALNVSALSDVKALDANSDVSEFKETGISAASLTAGRVTRTIVSHNGVEIPPDERVTELVDPFRGVPTALEGGAETITVITASAASEATRRVSPSKEEITSDPIPAFVEAAETGPRRKAAKILPVVISAFVDARGVFHERKIIWLEVEPADWVLD